MINRERTTFLTSDNCELTGTCFQPPDPPKGHAIVASAMATPRSLYETFAEWLAGQGYSVLTFDYRGSGDSFPDDLNYNQITMGDWARQDLPGALQYAKEHFGGGPSYVFAHSLSGQILGLNGDELELDALVTFSSQSCYWQIQHPNQRYRMLFYSYVLFPLLNRVFGYLPWSMLFGGEDVPPRVARTWSEWCRNPEYFLGDESLTERDNFRNFTAPILSYSFEDDEWGYPEAIDWLMDVYENADVRRIHVDPGETDQESIGHFGFFHPKMQAHWQDLLDRLESL